MDVLGCRGATWALLARLPTPEEAKAVTVPADHCVGTDDYEHVGPVCPNGREPGPEDPVCALEPEPFGSATAENRELLAESKVLPGQLYAGANQRAQGPKGGDEHGEHDEFCPARGRLPRIVVPTSPDAILAGYIPGAGTSERR